MSTITDTKKLLTGFPHIDKVYTYQIPDSAVNTTDKTIALLREVQVQTDEEGNNRFNAINTQLQLQIFLKKDIDFDTEQFQIDLFRLFESNQYECYTFGGWVSDPDTGQLFNSIYIEKLKYTD